MTRLLDTFVLVITLHVHIDLQAAYRGLRNPTEPSPAGVKAKPNTQTRIRHGTRDTEPVTLSSNPDVNPNPKFHFLY